MYIVYTSRESIDQQETPNTPKLSKLCIYPESTPTSGTQSPVTDAKGNEEWWEGDHQEPKQAAEAWLEQNVHCRGLQETGRFQSRSAGFKVQTLKLLEEEAWGSEGT